MYKLVAFDLDGTLLNENKTINKENIEIIEDLSSKGIEVIIATGRGYMSAKRLVRKIHTSTICISNNGAIIRDLTNNNNIKDFPMKKEIVKDILNKSDNLGLTPLIHVNEFNNGIDVYYRKDNERFYEDKRGSQSTLRFHQVDEFEDEHLENVLALAYFDYKDKTHSLYDVFKEEDIGEYKFNYHVMENVQATESLIEFMGKGVSKWNAIKYYSDIKGIKEDEIIVFGDDINDIHMVKNAGIGIAMKNASDRVKEHADIITKEDNNGLGIKLALEEIFF